MDIEKLRAEFELWCRRTQGGSGRRNDDGEYISEDWEYSWWAWQASRAALVVELPPRFDAGFDAVLHEHQDGEVLEYEATVSAITAAGITTIGETRPPQWSGWACQYPGKMPRLYGDLAIARLNCDSENGDQLIFLSAVSAAGITVKEGV